MLPTVPSIHGNPPAAHGFEPSPGGRVKGPGHPFAKVSRSAAVGEVAFDVEPEPTGQAGSPGSAPPSENGLFNSATRDRAQRALSEAGPVDPNHSLLRDKQTQIRRLEQLGIDLDQSPARIMVRDIEAEHGAAVTRVIAGETGLAGSADLALVAPDPRPRAGEAGDHPGPKDSPTARTARDPDAEVRRAAEDAIDSVRRMGSVIRGIRKERTETGDDRPLLVNMSYGLAIEDLANDIAVEMLQSDPGSKAHEKVQQVLGEPPRVQQLEDGSEQSDVSQVARLKREYLYPEFEKVLSEPRMKRKMKAQKRFTEEQAQAARNEGVLIFQAAGNSHQRASLAGRPDMSRSVTQDIDGLFTVGALDASGTEVAHFSSDGQVQASARGVDVPVGQGGADVNGTSYATPLMLENAWAVLGANPELSVSEVERILTDPRVASDVAETDRDGAGGVDLFAAVLVARDPSVSAAKIAQIRTQLDAEPEGRFSLGRNGRLRPRSEQTLALGPRVGPVRV